MGNAYAFHVIIIILLLSDYFQRQMDSQIKLLVANDSSTHFVQYYYLLRPLPGRQINMYKPTHVHARDR